MAIDQDRLHAFLGKAVGDLGAALSAVLVSIGDELGLYEALAAEPLTAGELAERSRRGRNPDFEPPRADQSPLRRGTFALTSAAMSAGSASVSR